MSQKTNQHVVYVDVTLIPLAFFSHRQQPFQNVMLNLFQHPWWIKRFRNPVWPAGQEVANDRFLYGAVLEQSNKHQTNRDCFWRFRSSISIPMTDFYNYLILCRILLFKDPETSSGWRSIQKCLFVRHAEFISASHCHFLIMPIQKMGGVSQWRGFIDKKGEGWIQKCSNSINRSYRIPLSSGTPTLQGGEWKKRKLNACEANPPRKAGSPLPFRWAINNFVGI